MNDPGNNVGRTCRVRDCSGLWRVVEYLGRDDTSGELRYAVSLDRTSLGDWAVMQRPRYRSERLSMLSELY